MTCPPGPPDSRAFANANIKRTRDQGGPRRRRADAAEEEGGVEPPELGQCYRSAYGLVYACTVAGVIPAMFIGGAIGMGVGRAIEWARGSEKDSIAYRRAVGIAAWLAIAVYICAAPGSCR